MNVTVTFPGSTFRIVVLVTSKGGAVDAGAEVAKTEKRPVAAASIVVVRILLTDSGCTKKSESSKLR